jgi:hypothetical protein
MAITFEDEEKHSPIGTIFGVILLVVVFGAAGFYGIHYLISSQSSIVASPSAAIQMNKEVLSDPRLDSLELMLEIVPGDDTVGHDNPFQQLAVSPKTVTIKTNTAPDLNGSGDGNTNGNNQSSPTSGTLQHTLTK